MKRKDITISKKVVNFEQAKNLHLYGFNQKTEFAYDKSGNFLHKNAESFSGEVMYFAPEQWLAIEWISIVFDVEIEARPVRYAGEKTSFYEATINCCAIPPKKRKGIPQWRDSIISSALDYFFANIDQYLITR